tara:strand:+ start:3350 stop:4171 length:822 start_codon:yes stop_codon:yes gene_type:complete
MATSIASVDTTDANPCTQLCSLSFDYGENFVTSNITLESNSGVVFNNDSYTLTETKCYKLSNNNYQLEMHHYDIDERLLIIVIPISNDNSSPTLDLNSIDLNNTVPKEAFHVFYFDDTFAANGTPDEGNICIFFTNKNYTLSSVTSDSAIPSPDINGDYPAPREIQHYAQQIYYNSIGTRMNGVYSSADDIYIDCSPVGESEEEIIYSKKNDVLNDFTSTRETTSTIKRETTSTIKRYKKKILSAENRQMVYGILAGLFSIALFNRAFTKIIK